METFDKKKIALDCWKHGNISLGKEDWKYAIESYKKAVMLAPDNVTYRQSLRGTEKRLYNDNKSGARMGTIKLAPIKAKLKKATMQKAWDEIDKLCEEGLEINPWDAGLNYELGISTLERGFQEVALYCFLQSLEMDQQNVEYHRQVALLQQSRGNYNEAIKHWEFIRKIQPNNTEARQMISDCATQETIYKGKYETAETTQEVKETQQVSNAYEYYEHDRSKAHQEAVVGPGMSEEEDLKRAIRKDATKRENYLKLADYYKREKKFEDAIAMYQKALEISGGDPAIREMMEDVELQVLRENLDKAKADRDRHPDNEAKQTMVKQLTRELLLREIEVLTNRESRYTNDMRIKYDLAQRLIRIKKYENAIPLLQRASNDTRIKGFVLITLGKCFIAEGKEKLAATQFERAIPELNQQDNPDEYCDAHYWAGRLAEKAKNKPKAEDHYNEVLGVNYNYLDTRTRLENLQEGP